MSDFVEVKDMVFIRRADIKRVVVRNEYSEYGQHCGYKLVVEGVDDDYYETSSPEIEPLLEWQQNIIAACS